MCKRDSAKASNIGMALCFLQIMFMITGGDFEIFKTFPASLCIFIIYVFMRDANVYNRMLNFC